MKLLEILAPLLLIISIIGVFLSADDPPRMLFFLFCVFVGLAGCIVEIVIWDFLDH